MEVNAGRIREMKNTWRSVPLVAVLAAVAWLGGCGGGSSKTVAVTISPTTATVPLGATQQFTAAVTGTDTTTVTWSVNSVTGGNSTVGTISTQGLYTAPVNAGLTSVTVTATSTADTTKTASATVTINSGAKVTVQPTDGVTLGVGETYQFADTVTNTSNPDQSTAVYWLVNDVQGGNSSTGTITTTGLYTAPAYVGSTTTYVIKATLQSDSSSYGTTKVTVVPAGAPTLSSLSPSTVAQGSAFEDIYLSGSGFLSTSIARVNGNPVETSYITTNVLRARVPAEDLAAAGTLYVDAQQQSGALSSAVRLNVTGAPTALISTSPNSTPQNGGALSVNFTGGYYTSGSTTAQFNGQVRSATVQDSRHLNVAVNAADVKSAGLYSVSVRNTGSPSQISASNVAVASTETPTILTTLSVGPTPMSVAVDTATGMAVVANSGTGTNGNSISLIDLNPASDNYLKQVSNVPVGTSPTGVAIDNLRNYAVITNNGDNSISIVDLSGSTPVVKATITDQIDFHPYAVGVNPLTGQALVVYQNSSTATIIDLNSLAVSATGQIPTTGANPQVSVDPRMNWGIVTPGGTGSVAVVDLNRSGRNVVSLIDVPSSNGAKRSGGTVTITTTGDHGLAIGEKVVVEGVDDASFDGTYTVATVPSTTTFTYSQSGVDATSGNGTVSAAAPLVTISLNQDMRGVAVNSETEQAVLADPSSTSITLMSLLDQTIDTMTLEVGTTASAVNPLTNMAVTVNSVGNQASVLDLQTKRRTAEFTVGAKPTSVAIDPVTNVAVVVNQSAGTVTLIQLGSIRPLHITQISPFNSLTSTASKTLTVVGNGFTAGSVVRLNETPLATSYVNSRTITATIPSSMLGAPQRYIVDVLNPDQTISNVQHFTVMQAINVGTAPRAVAIDRDRGLAVISNSGSDSVSVINLNTLSIAGTLKVGSSPQGVAVSSRAGRAVVANRDDDNVSIIDLDNIAVATSVSVAPSSGTSKPVGVAIHPGSGMVVVTDSNASQVSFFNVTTPGTATSLSVDVGPNAVAIDPTRNIAAVTEGATGQVVLIDLSTQQVLDRVSGFQLPTGAIYDPDSDTFLITSSLANNVGAVTARPDSGTYTVAFNRMGINPTGIDYNYRTSTLVTTNTTSQSMSVMDFLGKTVEDIIPLPVSQQFGVAIDPVTNRAVVVDQENNRVLIVPLPK